MKANNLGDHKLVTVIAANMGTKAEPFIKVK